MCRLLAFNTESFDPKFAEALRKSAQSDPFFSLGSHTDGWGVAVYFQVDGEWRSLVYRTKVPIFRDPLFDSVTKTVQGRKAVGVMHVRQGRRFLYALTNNHPYHARARNYDLFFVHNGSILRKAFPQPTYPATDSFLYFQGIVRLVEEGLPPLEAYSKVSVELMQYASSLNSALLAYDEVSGPSVYYLSYHNRARARELDEYYAVYRHDGYVFSSTLRLYLGIGERVVEGTVTEIPPSKV